MELKDFIKTTLVQIVRGIEEADAELEGSSAMVNPTNIVTIDKQPMRTAQNLSRAMDRIVEQVDFDVAVFAKEGSEAKGGLGLFVGAIGVGTQGKLDQTSGTESRIKFSVPVVFPESRKK